MEAELIVEALHRLDDRIDAGPGLLPFLYTDVLKERTLSSKETAASEIRRAIDACEDCDQYGRLWDNVAADCPKHKNFRSTSHVRYDEGEPA